MHLDKPASDVPESMLSLEENFFLCSTKGSMKMKVCIFILLPLTSYFCCVYNAAHRIEFRVTEYRSRILFCFISSQNHKRQAGFFWKIDFSYFSKENLKIDFICQLGNYQSGKGIHLWTVLKFI